MDKNPLRPRGAVLVDTNILVSGLVFTKGNEHKVLRLAEDKEISLVLLEFVVKEARTVLGQSFPGQETLLDAFLQRTQHTAVPMNQFEREIHRYRERVRDAKDTAVLAATIVTKPDFTVTGDKTLREDMKQSREVTDHTIVCSSSEFLKEISKRS